MRSGEGRKIPLLFPFFFFFQHELDMTYLFIQNSWFFLRFTFSSHTQLLILPRPQLRGQSAPRSHQKTRLGKDPLPSLLKWLLVGLSSLWVFGLRASVPCWLSAGSHPQLLEATTIPCHWDSLTWPVTSSKVTRDRGTPL